MINRINIISIKVKKNMASPIKPETEPVGKSNTLTRPRPRRSVSFTEDPQESRGLFLRELLNGSEGFSTREIKEILKLRSEAATADWIQWPEPPHPHVNGPQGSLRYTSSLPSLRPHSRVPSRPFPKTVSKIIDEEQVLAVISSLIRLIKLEIDPQLSPRKKISIYVQKKKAINTLRILYGLDLSDESMREMYGIDEIDFENIDSELKLNRSIIDSYNDYYHQFAIQKYRENNESHTGGSLKKKSSKKNKKITKKLKRK